MARSRLCSGLLCSGVVWFPTAAPGGWFEFCDQRAGAGARILELLVLADVDEGLGLQSRSATAASFGHTLASMLLASTPSPHIGASPPSTSPQSVPANPSQGSL